MKLAQKIYININEETKSNSPAKALFPNKHFIQSLELEVGIFGTKLVNIKP